MVRFEVLGPVRVRRGGEVVTVAGVMRRNLLAMLVAQANASVPVDALLDALWGGQVDARAAQRLHVHVHKLRAVLGDPGRISYGPGGYSLQVLPGELDADEFDMLVDEATGVAGADPQRCVELLRKAVGLFRGVPYHGVDLVGLAGEVQRCTERRLVAFEELYAAELRCGRHAAIVGELTELASQYPVRERLHGLLMTALYQGGRQADALAVYRNARAALVDELGLEPGPELREIEQQVLAGETIATGGHEQHTRGVPAQLPPAPGGFIGRDAQLAELDTLVTDHDSESAVIASLTGSGGVGKTALALWWAHHARDRFGDGHLYVDLRGYGPDEPVRADDALAGFLRALGVDGAAIPHDLDERSARLRSLLAGTRTLLVLDNARTVEQVRALLPASPGCVVLVTSRDPLVGLGARDGAHRVMLDQFSTDEANDLLRALLGTDRVHADPAGMNRLVQRCARLPLALRIAAERIRLRPDSAIDDLVDELDDPDDRLDALDTSGDPYSSVRSVLSWSYDQLPAPAARMFRLWGLHPGHDIDKPALAALTGHDTRTTRRALETLRHAHLAHETTPGRYHLHDLLRAYATELTHHTDNDTTRHDASTRLFEHYLATATRVMEWLAPHESELPPHRTAQLALTADAFTHYETARQWLDTERPNLIELAEHAPDHNLPTYTTDLSTILWQYLDTGWHQYDAKLVHTRALHVAHHQHDQTAEAIALRNLGLTRYRANEYEQATAYLEQALQLQLELGETRSQAMTLNYLAGAYQIVGRVDDAFAHLRWALELHRTHSDRSREMRPLQNLAILYRRRGQHAEAEECLNRALTISEEADHRSNKARILRDLARLHMETARPGDALDYAHRALKIADEDGIRGTKGTVLDTLGVVNRQLGNTDKAIEHHHEALVFARTSGDGILVAKLLNGLAETSVVTGRTDDAYRLYWEALDAHFGSATRFEHARAYAGLGDLYAALDEHSTAAEHWQQALEIYRDLQAPEADAVATKLLDTNPGTANTSTDEHADED